MSDDKDSNDDLKGAKVYDLGACEGSDMHHVAFHKEGKVKLGHASPMKDGEQLHPGESMLVLDKESKVTDTFTRPSNGPARVATKAYRSNYDSIFGTTKKKPSKELN